MRVILMLRRESSCVVTFVKSTGTRVNCFATFEDVTYNLFPDKTDATGRT